MTRRIPTSRCLVCVALGALSMVTPASAEVRFGRDVHIGGYDFSHRRHGSVHIQRVKRLPGPMGCRYVRNGFYRRGDGSAVRGPMEQCNLPARR